MPIVVTSVDSDGMSQRRWEPHLMPRWPNEMLEASFFIFESEADAKSGTATGGCGFFASVPWESNKNRDHIYAITCRHVISGQRPHVIRATKVGADKPTTIPASYDKWTTLNSDDLAVMRIDDGEHYRHEGFLDLNLTDQIIDDYSIGIGDEVISVGRFIDIRGQRSNRPMVRSGIVSAMPELPIVRANKPVQDSYIAEMRSRSGFSGSPVYIYIPPWQPCFTDAPRRQYGNFFHGPWLLGVHWGEMPVDGPDAPKVHERKDLSEDRKRIELGSGMIGVVPCKRLANLLLSDERVLRERRQFEANEPKPQAFEQSSPPTSDENPNHREDFTHLLGAAAQKPTVLAVKG